MGEFASVILSLDELWLLRSVVRHEVSEQRNWQRPPANLDLNGRIARAVLRCEELHASEDMLPLTTDDCLVLDYVVPQDARDVNGRPIGKALLLKVFAARRSLEDGPITACMPTAEEPAAPTAAEVVQRLQERQEG